MPDMLRGFWRWQAWQFSWRIGSTSLWNVGVAGTSAANAGAASNDIKPAASTEPGIACLIALSLAL